MRIICAMLTVAALLVAALPGRAGTTAPPASGHAVTPEACPDIARLPPTPFRDVRGSVHESGVVCAAWYDLVRGRGTSTFAPTRSMRRDQIASLLDRLRAGAGITVPDSAAAVHFDDVAGNAHGAAITTMARLAVMDGESAGLFRPGQAASRRDIAVWLVRLAALADVTVEEPPDAFPDDDGAADEHAIDIAAALGIMEGRPDGTLAGDVEVRRDQAASLLARAVHVLAAADVLGSRSIPAFEAQRSRLSADARAAMHGTTWRPGCPVALEALTSIRVRYWGYDARPRWGRVIVARSVAADVIDALGQLYDRRFQIRRMRPAHRYGGDDGASMAANNTSAFNCRAVTGGSGWSQHSFGTAIDINPRQNPYVRGNTVLPPSARRWLRRRPVRRGMISGDGPVVRAFTGIGWGWGGSYATLKDYQHFSETGG